MIPQKGKQAAVLLLYALSGISFGLSICANRFVFCLLSIPFVLLVVSTLHEFGHAVGCIINKNKITGIRTALFTVQEGRLSINERLSIGGYCTFIKSEHDAPVFLCGPLASLLCFCVCLAWWLCARPDNTALVCTAITGLHVLKNGLPHGNNDLRLFIKELTKGDPSV